MRKRRQRKILDNFTKEHGRRLKIELINISGDRYM
jgi:hypothetical protein